MTNYQIAFYIVLVYALPAIVSWMATFLGLSILRYEAIDDPEAVSPESDDPEREWLHGELLNAGFRPVGIIREKAYLICGRIRKVIEVPRYQSGDGLTYVSVYRLYKGDKLRTAVQSYTSGGATITAAMPGVKLKKLSKTICRVEFPAISISKLLDRQAEIVREFCHAMDDAPQRIDLAEVAAREEATDRAMLRGQ